MGPWEYLDDDGVFGAPGIEQIKADPGVINWEWWDNVFTHPPEGSPFWYATDPGVGWQGNWRQIFGPLKQHGVKPIVSLRVQNAQTQPDWAAALNPPNTEAGRNEWWEHVFSVVYWMNVRNDYRVDDWEIGNEANHKGQGWAGTDDDYWDFARLTHDAIDYVYRRFLPHRRHRIYAPVSAGTSVNEAGERFGWIKDALQKVPNASTASITTISATIRPRTSATYTPSWTPPVRGAAICGSPNGVRCTTVRRPTTRCPAGC